MDDKSPNSSASQSNIDDLVKELSRPQGSPPSPTSPSSQNPTSQPAPMSPPRPMGPPPMASSSVPLPPKPNPAPVAPVTPAVPKEYQSSIRTMSDDLSKLKAGQQPQGVNIPRKIDNTPVPVKPVVPPVTSAPAPAKQTPTVSMPSATRSAPMVSAPNQAPKSPISTPIPRPVMPAMPPAAKAPGIKPEIKPDEKNQFYVPPAETKPAGSRNIFFIIIAAVVVVFAGLYWYFFIQSPSQVAEETPTVTATPVPTATPNPDILSTIFTVQGGTIMLPAAGDPSTVFKNTISAQPNITPGTLTLIGITSGASGSAQVLTIPGLFNRFVASYPSALATLLGQNYRFLLYGQKESFDSKGQVATNVVPGSRLVMVSEIASSSAAVLQGWESTMSTDLSGVMTILPAKNTGAFTSTNYDGVIVRFKNFSYPDHSIDYALVSSNGKTYLIFAGSREAMFATIDALAVPAR